MTELTHNEAEEKFANELRGLSLNSLARLVVKICDEGERQDIYDQGIHVDGHPRPHDAVPRESIWYLTIMGLPMEMHYYVRSPARLVMMRDREWSVGFSTALILSREDTNRQWVALELDRRLLPEDRLLGRGVIPITGPKKFRAFSFKRKGNPKIFRHDMSILRLAI